MYLTAIALSITLLAGAPGDVSTASKEESPTSLEAPSFLPHPNDLPQKPIFKSCTAQINCPPPFDSGSIMCTGNAVCQATTWDISCDGNITACSCSIAPSGCWSPFEYCLCRYYGVPHWRCASDYC